MVAIHFGFRAHWTSVRVKMLNIYNVLLYNHCWYTHTWRIWSPGDEFLFYSGYVWSGCVYLYSIHLYIFFCFFNNIYGQQYFMFSLWEPVWFALNMLLLYLGQGRGIDVSLWCVFVDKQYTFTGLRPVFKKTSLFWWGISILIAFHRKTYLWTSRRFKPLYSAVHN